VTDGPESLIAALQERLPRRNNKVLPVQ
jgi:hypothetical protein